MYFNTVMFCIPAKFKLRARTHPATYAVTDPATPETLAGELPTPQPIKPHQPVQLAKTGWVVLKGVLGVVHDGSDLFLPLKLALVGVVKAMDIVDVRSVSVPSDTISMSPSMP